MKYRKNILAAMGLLMAVTVTTPALAAGTGSAAESRNVQTEVQQSGRPALFGVQNLWSWSKVTVDGKERYKLTYDGQPVSDGIHQVQSAVYFTKDSLVLTGVQKVTTVPAELSGVITAGSYYFKESAEDTGALFKGNGWMEVSNDKWLYFNSNGQVDTSKTGFADIHGERYLLDQDGKILKGVQEYGGNKYYMDPATGVLVKGPKWAITIDEEILYIDAEGKIVVPDYTGWVDIESNRYYMEQGVPVKGWVVDKNQYWFYTDPETGIMQTGWICVDGKWSYLEESGLLHTQWLEKDGLWYYLGMNGELTFGWQKIGGTWYYMNEKGVLMTGWLQLGNTFYYLDNSGALVTGWQQLGGKWYYMDESGAMVTGWQQLGGRWYYMDGTGAMVTGWVQLGGRWYYMDGTGAMVTGWQQLGGKWYYMDNSGAAATGWLKLDGKYYYMDESGAMLTGWYMTGGKWYYSNGSGVMQAGCWIGEYYLTASGAMAVNTWVGDKFMGRDGKWVPNYDPVSYNGNWELSDGKWYYRSGDGSYLKNGIYKIGNYRFGFHSDGSMATGWMYDDGIKYYFNASGHLMEDLDGILPKQSSYYITINRAKCQVTVYAKDGGNGYIIPVKTFACSVGLPATPTAEGTYQTQDKHRWKMLMGPSWGQYATRIYGGVLFHSVAGGTQSIYNVNPVEYNKLGSPASHGCVRLNVRDAKWIYDNCPSGTTVKISDRALTPFEKPATIKIPAGQNWDPTDPAIAQ